MCFKKIISPSFEKKKTYHLGILAGVVEAFYVLLVVLLINWLGRAFADLTPTTIYWIPFLYLLFLVLSVAISGVVVFGYPLYLLLNKEVGLAVRTVLITLLVLILIILISFVFLFIFLK
jgi:hypothetical protein